jgi:hypothetical protein
VTAERRTRITIERERILVLARQLSTRGRCEICGHEIEFLQQEQVRSVLEVVSGQRGEASQERLHLPQAKSGLVTWLRSTLQFLQAARSRHRSRSKEN